MVPKHTLFHPPPGFSCSSNCSSFLQQSLTLLLYTHHGYAKPSEHTFFAENVIHFHGFNHHLEVANSQMHRWDLYSLPNSSSGSPYWLAGILTWLFHSHQNLKTNTFTKPPPFLDFSKYFSTDAFIHSMCWHSKCIPFLSLSGLGTSHPYSPTPNQWPGLSVPVLLYGSQLPFP